MKTYQEILEGYKKRRYDSVVDVISTGLTYADNIAVDAGLLEETGLLTELAESACGALPFVVIAATEGTKVILGRKPGMTGVKDGAYRMVKTGAALGIGSAVAGAAGLWAAIPTAMGVRALFDRYRSRALTGVRVQHRTQRLKELRSQLETGAVPEEEARDRSLPEGEAAQAMEAAQIQVLESGERVSFIDLTDENEEKEPVSEETGAAPEKNTRRNRS